MNENSILLVILIRILYGASNVIRGKNSTGPRDDESDRQQQQISSPASSCVNRQDASSAEKASFLFLEPVIGAINKR